MPYMRSEICFIRRLSSLTSHVRMCSNTGTKMTMVNEKVHAGIGKLKPRFIVGRDAMGARMR